MKTVGSLGEMAAILARNIVSTTVAAEHAMAKAAKVVQEDAKDRIGEYQLAVGPFQKWLDLKDETKEERLRLGYSEDDPLFRSGALRNSIVTEHTAKQAIIGSKLPIAAYQEFGTNRISPRPFLGPAAYARKKQICAIIGAHFVSALVGDDPVHVSLGYDREVT